MYRLAALLGGGGKKTGAGASGSGDASKKKKPSKPVQFIVDTANHMSICFVYYIFAAAFYTLLGGTRHKMAELKMKVMSTFFLCNATVSGLYFLLKYVAFNTRRVRKKKVGASGGSSACSSTGSSGGD